MSRYSNRGRKFFCCLLGGVAILLVSSAMGQDGFYVLQGRLFDANDVPFVIRGVNHPHTWYRNEIGSIADIKSYGGNTVRVVLASGNRWSANSENDVANVIEQCKSNRLICMLEVHDTTGFGDEPLAATLDEAVDYWISIKSALIGQEKFVLLNIGNEPIGNNLAHLWEEQTIDAISRLRNAGFEHTIVVDAPNWGQDWTNTMRNNAASVFASDPNTNLVFSVHMYGVYGTPVSISSYLTHFVANQIPIIIGEFGHFHSDGDVDEDTIFQLANDFDIGYLGWSWSGNGAPVGYLDMVENFDRDQLTFWGDRIFFGENGIASTSVEATVFFVPGDVNMDGSVNLLDVMPFVDLISIGGYSGEADVNGDGVLNLLDVEPFVQLLAG